MKKVFPLLASANLLLGQSTVITCFDEEHDLELPSLDIGIGIVPVKDYQKAMTEIARLKGELKIALQKQGAAPDNAKAGDERVEALRQELTAAYRKMAAKHQDKEATFLQREEALIVQVNELEKQRALNTGNLEKKFAALQTNFGREQGEWEKKLLFVEKERDEALEKWEESQNSRTQQQQAWETSVADWRRRVATVTRDAQIKNAQEAIANTARLAKEWQVEKAELEALLAESETLHAQEIKSWEGAVANWQQKTEEVMRAANVKEAQQAVAATARLAKEWQTEKAGLEALMVESQNLHVQEIKVWGEAVAAWQKETEAAVRASNVKEAQEAVANTARLAADWQKERQQLEAQVKEMSANLAQLQAKQGAKQVQKGQTEVLQLGLAKKSKALEELGNDASRLALIWKKERETARNELDSMRVLYKATARDASAHDQKVKQLEETLSKRNKSLSELATRAEQLTVTWKTQRGGLQQKLAELEQQFADCQKKLEQSLAREKTSSKQAKQLSEESNKLMGESQKASQANGEISNKLHEQMALVTELRSKLILAKKSEGNLKNGLEELRTEVSNLKKDAASYQSTRENSEQVISKLRAELKQANEKHASCERELAAMSKKLKEKDEKIAGLKAETVKLDAELAQARKELKGVREELKGALKDADVNKKARAEADARQAEVKNLEGQLGKLAVEQQELEGNLTSTLGDLEKLQASYLLLQTKSADGGEVTKKAIAKREQAEEELIKVRKQLQSEEAKLKEARKRVKEIEAKQKETEAKAAAGKAALGKSEAELNTTRRELGALQLGKQQLVKEVEELRKRFVQIQPVRYQLASANVVAQQQRVLAEVRQVLEVYPEARFNILGHTCNLGSEDGNLKLSSDRAVVLQNFLLENGIAQDRILTVEGFGHTQPLANNETDEGRRQNRRVEIKVIK